MKKESLNRERVNFKLIGLIIFFIFLISVIGNINGVRGVDSIIKPGPGVDDNDINAIINSDLGAPKFNEQLRGMDAGQLSALFDYPLFKDNIAKIYPRLLNDNQIRAYVNTKDKNNFITQLAKIDEKYTKELVSYLITNLDKLKEDPNLQSTLTRELFTALNSAKNSKEMKNYFLDQLRGEKLKTGRYDYKKLAEFRNNALDKLDDKSKSKETEFVANYILKNEQNFRGVKNDGKLRNGDTMPPINTFEGFGKFKINSDGSFDLGKGKTFRIAANPTITSITDSTGKTIPIKGDNPSNVPPFTSELKVISQNDKNGVVYKIENYNDKFKGTGTFYTITDLSDGGMNYERQFYGKDGKLLHDAMQYNSNGGSFTATSQGAITTFKGTASKSVSYTSKDDVNNYVFPYMRHGDSIITVADGQSSFEYSVNEKGNIVGSKNIGEIFMNKGYGQSLESHYNSVDQKYTGATYDSINNNPVVFMGLKGEQNVNIYNGEGEAKKDGSENFIELTKKGVGKDEKLSIETYGVRPANPESPSDLFFVKYPGQPIEKNDVKGINSKFDVWGSDGSLISVDNKEIRVFNHNTPEVVSPITTFEPLSPGDSFSKESGSKGFSFNKPQDPGLSLGANQVLDQLGVKSPARQEEVPEVGSIGSIPRTEPTNPSTGSDASVPRQQSNVFAGNLNQPLGSAGIKEKVKTVSVSIDGKNKEIPESVYKKYSFLFSGNQLGAGATNSRNLDQLASGNFVLKIGTEWCGPCRKMNSDFSGSNIGYVGVDVQSKSQDSKGNYIPIQNGIDVASKFGIGEKQIAGGYPYSVVYKNGKPVQWQNGVISPQQAEAYFK